MDESPCSRNVYTQLAETVFNVRMTYGQVEGAATLEKCGDRLQAHRNDTYDKVLRLVLCLANFYENPSDSMFRSSHQVYFMVESCSDTLESGIVGGLE